MTILQSIILGVVQGLTEFLPISSSGHLVIVPFLLGWEIPPLDAFIFDVLVQVATLIAVFAYFWNELVVITRAVLHSLKRRQPLGDPQARLGWFILLATVPAGIIGLALKDFVEKAFSSAIAASIALLLTAGLLVLAERVGKRNRHISAINWADALWIGAFQALAIFPGVSRSGATITGGMTRDLERADAARFSFLISIPIMLAAGLVAILDLFQMPDFAELLPVYIPGFIAAAFTGYFAIRWLLRYLVKGSLYGFAVYCATLGLITLTVNLLRN